MLVLLTDPFATPMTAIACETCRLPTCLCPAGGPIATGVEIVVVRHFVERHKMSGSARLLPLAIEGATIIDVGGAGADARDQVDIEQPPGSYLLFPGGAPLAELPAAPRRLVVPDGTWAQARRMRTRVPMLAALPSVSLVDPAPSLHLRAPRHSGELPTAIAVARFLDACGEGEAAALVERLFNQMHQMLTER